MKRITFQKQLLESIPSTRLGCIQCKVKVKPAGQKIIELSEVVIAKIRSEQEIENISSKPTVSSTKEAYRKLGKDPSRYRPSAEALTRRIVNGKGLYQVNNIVDLLNLISLQSGFSIGGYDADKIVGQIEFGIGKPNEPYQAIGRGNLNIENLPIFRDDLGAFGSPTSDSVRTMVTDKTTTFLMVIIDFNAQKSLEICLDWAIGLLREYAQVSVVESKIVAATK